MILIISPAKNINFDVEMPSIELTEVRFAKEAKHLLNILKEFSATDIASLMGISAKLAQLNFERYQLMEIPYGQSVSKAALLVFNGAVFQGMDVLSFENHDLEFSQKKLRILSGFYGLLRPLDCIMPYRLEMGTSLKVDKYKNLYEFWGNKINLLLQNDLKENGDDVLINLASNEYFKAIKQKELNARIITPVFKDYKNGQYKMIAIYAKKARGMMAAYILKNKIDNPDEIKHFDFLGYEYNDLLSENDNWVFTRG